MNKLTLPDREFYKFNKIPRLIRDCVITEKIDGTNASIMISEEGTVYAASRTNWITPENDNYGFAAWVEENQDTLIEELGVGLHRGEWCGKKIQRGYDLDTRHFVLFDPIRYQDNWLNLVKVVPELYRGTFSTISVGEILINLHEEGSMFAPGFMQPEGIVVKHLASGHFYKATLENDQGRKGGKR